MQITVTVTGLDDAQARLGALGDSLHDFTGALTSLGTALLRYYSETVFVTSGEALGSSWRALKDTTVKEKIRKWPGRGILQRSGAMQEGFYNDITPVSLFISNHVKYFEYNQLGTGEKGDGVVPGVGRGKNLPARPMLGVNSAVESLVTQVIEADVRAKIDSTMGA